MTKKQIGKKLYEEIVTWVKRGDGFARQGFHKIDISLYEQALTHYQEALRLISQLDDKSDLAGVVMISVGEAYFYSNNFKESKVAFENVSKLSNFDHPLLHFWLGKVYFKLGDEGRAKSELKKACLSRTVDEEIEAMNHAVYWEIVWGLSMRDYNKVLPKC